MKDPDKSMRPKVGVGIMVVRGDKILLGKRISSHGAGEYSVGGGHMEHGEKVEETALRELAEEVGEQVKVKNIRFLCASNMLDYMPKHYVDLGMVCEWVSGEPKTMEPDKHEFWDWYDINDVPEPLFKPIYRYIEAYKTGRTFFETT